MNAIDLLEKQHREVERLLNQAEKSDGDKLERLFTQIADALAIHASIEEKFFYPATKAARTEDLLREAVEEHLSVKRLLADLLEMTADDPQFAAKITVLKEQVTEHVEEERRDLFPQVRKMASAEELEDLGMVMEDAVAELREEGAARNQVPAETDRAAPI